MTALLAIVALVFGVLAFRKVGQLERELAQFEARVRKLERLPEEPRAAAAPEPEAPARVAASAAPPRAVLPPVDAAPPPPPPSPLRVAAPVATPPPVAPPSLPSSGRGWEELLGGRVLVWLGAIAMALGVVFLVRQFAGHLWLKPEFRLALGTLLGVALLATGEWLRGRSTRVASGTSAAGVAALFAVAYSATGLYHLVSPGVGFTFLALVAFTGVLLSLRQGLLVAVLGLVGGMATPALVSSDEPRAALLFGYLLLLEAAVFAVARRSAWWPLAAINGLAGLGWVFAWVSGPYTAGDSLWLGLFLLASTATAVATARGRWTDSPAGEGAVGRLEGPVALVGGGFVASLLTLGAVVVKGGFGPLEWGFVAVLAGAALALSALAPRFRDLGWLSAVLVGALLAAWGARGVESQLGLYFSVLLGALGLFAVVPYLLHLRQPEGRRGFAILAAATLVAVPLLAEIATAKLALPGSRGLAVLLLAAAAIAASLPLARRRAAGGSAVPLGAFAAAATALVSLAVPLELERAWWSVSWALEVPALAWLAGRLSLPLLGRLGVLVAAAVVARLTVNPYSWDYPIGSGALWNWLLYGYGVPVLALVGAVRLARARGSRRQAAALEAGATLVAVVWIFRTVHQIFHRGVEERPYFLEWAWVAALVVILGVALVFLGRRRERWTTSALGFATLALGLLASFVGAFNLYQDPVGDWPIVNGLLLAFAVPAVSLGALALGRPAEEAGIRRLLRVLCGLGALGYTFLWLTLEVRRFFRGPLLLRAEGSNAEGFAYSAAWVVLGTALLVFGLRQNRFALRLAGLGVLALAAVKVFLFDVAGLGDLYRVLSFLGLGASLLGLGYLYQRFVRSSS